MSRVLRSKLFFPRGASKSAAWPLLRVSNSSMSLFSRALTAEEWFSYCSFCFASCSRRRCLTSSFIRISRSAWASFESLLNILKFLLLRDQRFDAAFLSVSSARLEGSEVCRKDTVPKRVLKSGLIASLKNLLASSEHKISMVSEWVSISSV